MEYKCDVHRLWPKNNPLEKWQFLKICWIFCYETSIRLFDTYPVFLQL